MRCKGLLAGEGGEEVWICSLSLRFCGGFFQILLGGCLLLNDLVAVAMQTLDLSAMQRNGVAGQVIMDGIPTARACRALNLSCLSLLMIFVFPAS